MQENQINNTQQDESTILLKYIAQNLEEIVIEQEKLANPQKKTIFHASKKPSIQLSNYLMRIKKYCSCSSSCFILALIYLDRIQDFNPELYLTNLCIHRLMMTAIMVAIKYHDDDYYKNEYYAKVGGISLQEINKYEEQFLQLIGYQLFVDHSLFELYKDKLKQLNEI